MNKLVTIAVALAALTAPVGAQPAPAPPPVMTMPLRAAPAVFTVRVKRVQGGKTTFVPIAQISRDKNGTVTTKDIPAPSLDKLGTDFAAQWKAYRWPAKVTITETHPVHTGMSPGYKKHSFEFTKADPLYVFAVVRDYLFRRNYDALGMSMVEMIQWDTTSEGSPAEDTAPAYDRASTLTNFRKGTHVNWTGDVYTLWISAHLRPTRSPGKGRRSPTNKTRFLAVGYDQGLFPIARMSIYKDGHVEVIATTAADAFRNAWGTFDATRPVELQTIMNDTYETAENRTIAAGSPWLLEAYILERFEYHVPYDVTPVIDFDKIR